MVERVYNTIIQRCYLRIMRRAYMYYNNAKSIEYNDNNRVKFARGYFGNQEYYLIRKLPSRPRPSSLIPGSDLLLHHPRRYHGRVPDLAIL